MHGELVKLRADNAVLNERVDALELQKGSLKGYGTAGPSGQGDKPPLDVVHMGPDSGGPDDPNADTPRPVLRSSGKSAVVEEPAAAGKGGGDAQRDYDQAYELYKKASYDKALDAFAAFLARYPDHPNADNATFWRGECYLAKNDPRRAIEQFEAVVSSFPKGNKAPDALLRLVKAYTSTNDKEKAEGARKRFLSTYPTSDAAKKLAPGPGSKPGSPY